MSKEALSYKGAVDEIEAILQKIEEGELDVDELANSVKRATKLIKFCKEKLQKTEEEVTKILDQEE